MSSNSHWIERLDMSDFSEHLKLIRLSRNITQTRLAELVGADPRVYNRWERGTATPQLEAMIRIADILQVTLDELAGRKALSSEVKIHNHELRTLYEQVDNLSDEDQKALALVIDSLVKKNQMNKVIAGVK